MGAIKIQNTNEFVKTLAFLSSVIEDLHISITDNVLSTFNDYNNIGLVLLHTEIDNDDINAIYSFTINTKLFVKALKMVQSKNNTITLEINTDILVVSGTIDSVLWNTSVPIKSVPVFPEFKTPNDYETIIEVKSAVFEQIIKKINKNTESIDLVVTKDTLTIATKSTTIEVPHTSDVEITGTFTLPSLELAKFANAKTISKDITLYFGIDMPLCMTVGHVSMYLSVIKYAPTH
jgi:hypothetical protein